MKIRRMKKDQSPLVARMGEMEETLETIVDNLDTWMADQAGKLKSIRMELYATMKRLDELAGGGDE